jgi:hypothetical protein
MKIKTKQLNTKAEPTFDVSYYINYAAPAFVDPYSAVLLASGPNFGLDGKPTDPDRMIISYKREIVDENKEKIGDASYLINVYDVDIVNGKNGKTSGSMTSTFSGIHQLNYEDHEYDIYLQGNLEFQLGIRPGSNAIQIDASKPYKFIVGNTLDNISVTSVFRNNIKINNGRNLVTLNDNGNYNIQGPIDTYIPQC